MELINKDKRDGYIYDPIIKQYDTQFWKATTGTPAMSSTVLRFTSAAVSSYIQHIYADVEFKLTVPAAPTAGDVRDFGLRNPSGDGLGAAYFKVADTAFTFEVVDSQGVSASYPITWVAGWTANAKTYRIRWEKDQIIAYVDGVIKAVYMDNVESPMYALGLRINNGNADNLDLTYVAVRRAASII